MRTAGKIVGSEAYLNRPILCSLLSASCLFWITWVSDRLGEKQQITSAFVAWQSGDRSERRNYSIDERQLASSIRPHLG